MNMLDARSILQQQQWAARTGELARGGNMAHATTQRRRCWHRSLALACVATRAAAA